MTDFCPVLFHADPSQPLCASRPFRRLARACLAGASVFLLASQSAQAADHSFVLATNGLARAVIVVAKNAPPTVAADARMLADGLGKMAGTTFMVAEAPVKGYVTILVGAPHQASKPEEICVRVKDTKTLEVTGDGPAGIRFAVQDLLEHFGAVFCTPQFDYFPKQGGLALPGDYAKVEAPFMRGRRICSPVAQGDLDFSLKLRLNRADKKMAAYGGGQDWNFGASHYFPQLKEHAAYTKAGPRDKAGLWLCPSDEAMYPKLEKLIEEDIKKGVKCISLSVDDGGMMCHCEKCKKLCLVKDAEHPEGRAYPAIQNITLLNRMAKRFGKEYPDVVFSMLAYLDFPDAPPPSVCRFEPNVDCGIALLWRNFGRPVSACERSGLWHDDWAGLLGSRNTAGLYIWDYIANFSSFIEPFPNLDTIGMNMRHYKKIGVKCIDPQMQYSGIGDLPLLHLWLYAKLCWDPDADDKALTAHYLDAAYGAAAPFVQEYLNLIRHARDRHFGTWIGCYHPNTDHWLSGADCVKVMNLWDQAKRAVRNDPARLRMVNESRFSALTMALKRYNDMIGPAKKLGYRLPAREKFFDEWDDILAVANADGVSTDFSENNQLGTSFRNFFLESLKTPPQETSFTNRGKDSICVTAGDLTGGSRMKKLKDADGTDFARISVKLAGETENLWMNPEFAEAGFTLNPNQEGEWYVFATVRTGATVPYDRGAAYVGIYRPSRVSPRTGSMEIASMPVAGRKGDSSWQTVCLGKYILVDGTRIWMMNGILEPTEFADVKSFTLVDPAIIENTTPSAKDKPAPAAIRSVVVTAREMRGDTKLDIKKDEIDNFFYASVRDAAQGMPEYIVSKEREGKWVVFAAVRIDSDVAFDPAAASLELLAEKDKDGNQKMLASVPVKSEYGNASWQVICLGEHELSAGSAIRFSPALKAPLKSADLKSVMLVKPAVMTSSLPFTAK